MGDSGWGGEEGIIMLGSIEVGVKGLSIDMGWLGKDGTDDDIPADKFKGLVGVGTVFMAGIKLTTVGGDMGMGSGVEGADMK